MYGTFCRCAFLIFFCIRSSLASTSTRMPCSRSVGRDLLQVGHVRVRDGMPTTWTGASQGGNAPA